MKQIYVLLIASLIGLVFPQAVFALSLTSYMLPLLAVLVFIAAKSCDLRLPTKHELHMSSFFVSLHYLVISLSVIVLAHMFVANIDFRNGLILLALVPPAINVIPLTQVFNGNTRESLFAQILAYTLSCIIIPLGCMLLIEAAISLSYVFFLLWWVLLFPCICGVVVRYFEEKQQKHYDLSLIGLCSNAVIFYILVAANRDTLFSLPLADISSIFWIVVYMKFIVVTIAFFIASQMLAKKEVVEVLLFTGYKNISLAIALAITLLPMQSQIPLVISAMLFIVQTFFISLLLSLYKKVRMVH